MFASLATQETYVGKQILLSKKNVPAPSQKHFCFTDTNFASEAYVAQFSHH